MPRMTSSITDAVAQRLDAARAFALEAGNVVLRRFQPFGVRDALGIEMKADGSPVTLADREAEALLRERVAVAFPDDGFIGEEFGPRESRGAFRWIVDPIDGTKSFAQGVPLFGTLIAVETLQGDRWRSVVGVVNMPALGEVVSAGKGLGAWHESGGTRHPARVSRIAALRDAVLVLTGSEYTAAANAEGVQRRLAAACRFTRGWSDCYGLVLVATGRADLWFEPMVREWDVAPAPVILAEAGGRFSDWRGATSIRSGNALGSNGLLHDAALTLIRS